LSYFHYPVIVIMQSMKYALYFLAISVTSRAGLLFSNIGRQQQQQQ
jgi:hypothetical protein